MNLRPSFPLKNSKPHFNPHPVFDPSLFVDIRKRVGHKTFDSLNEELIKSVSKQKDNRHKQKGKGKNNKTPKNKGKMQADATVADQYITHPTDNGILNQSRKQCEKLIDKLYAMNGKQGVKPRRYRKKTDKAYLSYSKKKRKSDATHRKMTRKLLECVNRDIKHVNNLLDVFEIRAEPFPLKHSEQRMLWIICSVYAQQKYMYENKTHTCPDRIVSIYQPHVRPIPRGKIKAQTEFGSIYNIFNTITTTLMQLTDRFKVILEQQKILEEKRNFRLLPDVNIFVY
jgi:hypothetical protein